MFFMQCERLAREGYFPCNMSRIFPLLNVKDIFPAKCQGDWVHLSFEEKREGEAFRYIGY
jgi:hypothetical protein